MTHRIHHAPGPAMGKRSTFFSKTFRWQPVHPGDPQPASVEVAGTFTEWKRLPLAHDQATKFWQLTLHQIPGNCTHHYMLLVDSHPAKDKYCDGLAVPKDDTEKQFGLHTARGPRVFMLFSNTK